MKRFSFLILSFLFLFQTPLFALGEKIIISHVAGQPQIIRDGKTIPAQAGASCQTGDILKTVTPECHLDVAMNDLAGCRILPSSECVIVNGSESSMRFQIKSGNAILNLKKLPANSTFEVETPTAIAAVRGTQFWGRVDANNIDNPVTTFAVREGMVNIFAKNVGKTFSLEKGQALDIPKDSSTAPVIRPALETELKAMEQASSINTSA